MTGVQTCALPISFTKSRDTWVLISSVPEEMDVFDIHSGSDLLALDGTAYNEW